MKGKDQASSGSERTPSEVSSRSPLASYTYLAEHSPSAMAVLQGETNLLRYVNPAFCRLLNKEREALVGRPFLEIFPESRVTDLLALLERVYRTGEAACMPDQEHSQPGQPAVYWTYVVWPLGDIQGNLEGLVLQVNDTTDQVLAHRRSEQAALEMREINEQLLITGIREQEARAEAEAARQSFAFLAEASTLLATSLDYETTLKSLARLAVPRIADWCIIYIIEEDGSVRQLEAAHADSRRVKLLQELRSRYPFDPNRPHPVLRVLQTGRSELIPELPDSLMEAVAQDPEHLRILRELGYKSYMAVPLLARGRILGALTFVLAESGRRYSSADLALAEDLAHRAATALDNARLYHEIQKADRRKDEFLAMLAHELRNPLAPIQNALQVMCLRGTDDPVLKRSVDVVERQARQMVRLLDDLLDISRISRGKVKLQKEPLELGTVVARAVETSRPLIEARKHELSVSLPQEPVELEADPARLEQILVNLLNNAAKYTEPGGRIWLTCAQQGEEIVLRVRDTGMGIPADMLPRIFDPFIQVDQSLTRSQGGLGIGLALVRSLVEMHGGRVAVHSEGLGQGSEFLVYLPVLSEPGSRRDTGVRREKGRREIPRSPRRILVVDDNADAAKTLKELLELWGHEVQVVHDGQAALAAALTSPAELVLLDIGLPGIDGYEVARQLRQQVGSSSMVLVALTGYGQAEDQRRSREAGFDYHFTKPVDLIALRELLANE